MSFAEPSKIKSLDPQLFDAIVNEQVRQEEHLELIASENYASLGVMQLMGSVLTNKYAEGYPGKRYYGGCEYVDIAEELAIDRLKTLFKADYANVQPHSGSQANSAAMLAMIEPGDTILGMSLSDGGHLTHGASVNFSGRIYNGVTYGLNSEGDIDYDQVERLAHEHRPKLLVTGFSAFSQYLDWQRFRDIADSVGAYMLSDIAHVAGLIAVGLYPSPVGIADVTTSTTHKSLRGPRGGVIMAKANPDLEKKLQSAVFPGTQGGPLMQMIAAKAYAFKEALCPSFKEYQAQVIANAQNIAATLVERGYDIVSGGTKNHLALVDLTRQDITGKAASAALGAANITVNMNTVPGDKRSPFVTSGLRLGTPAITTRGMRGDQATHIGELIADVLDAHEDQSVIASTKSKVLALCNDFPVFDALSES
ncbi:MAG: serine hydroxymethyltransferase [Coxiellaceae bacterium]|nr:serine hydroxymethyltransferase [Coxiellaceae bacterium]